MPSPSARFRPAQIPLKLGAAAIAASLLAGCNWAPSAGARLTVASTTQPATITPALTTAAYVPLDASTADIYLSDLPPELFDPSRVRDLEQATGHLIHIHMFIVPKAGRTPVDSTACNVTVRQIILAGPVRGMYGGGGFLYPYSNSKPGNDRLSAELVDASLRLLRAQPGFSDRLGPAVMAGSVTAPKNERLARSMAAAFEGLLRTLPDVAHLPPPNPSEGDLVAPPPLPSTPEPDERVPGGTSPDGPSSDAPSPTA